jgi:two-component system LytT family response regulator
VIRALIVDDEAMARAKLARLLGRLDDVEIVGQAGSADDALAAIRAHAPDVVFMDVDMPDRTGFDAIEAFDVEPPPLVVFATAYAEFALRAFEVHAVDYLLKPFDAERLERTLQRVRVRLRESRGAGATPDLAAVLDELRSHREALERAGAPARPWPDRLLVQAQGGAHFVRVDDIDWIGSADNYIEVHVAHRLHLVREPLAMVERKLDPSRFTRIHRCAIVNLDRVASIRPLAGGQLELLLHDDTRLPVGRAYRERITRRWQGGP